MTEVPTRGSASESWGSGHDDPRPRRWLPRLLSGAALAVCALGLVTARVVVSGEDELRASTAALEQGDPREATVRARRAAGWYAPGAPHVAAAYARLQALARAAERSRRADIALLAWRAVRTAALETRWIVLPRGADLQLADREIARLEASAMVAGEPNELARELHGLARHGAPRVGWVAALVLGFGAWIAGLVWWAAEAARAGGKLGWARRGGVLLTAAGVALWLVAVWRA